MSSDDNVHLVYGMNFIAQHLQKYFHDQMRCLDLQRCLLACSAWIPDNKQSKVALLSCIWLLTSMSSEVQTASGIGKVSLQQLRLPQVRLSFAYNEPDMVPEWLEDLLPRV